VQVIYWGESGVLEYLSLGSLTWVQSKRKAPKNELER
jgi:hypothetical protein